jgi:hypothetical protein
MGSNRNSAKPRRNARANQRLNPIERALVRANWRKAEAELLALQDGADMTALLAGFCVNLADAHTIAETLADPEPAKVLDEAMGMVNRMCANGCRLEAGCAEFLAWAGSLAIEILLGSPMRDIEQAVIHRAKVLAEIAA